MTEDVIDAPVEDTVDAPVEETVDEVVEPEVADEPEAAEPEAPAPEAAPEPEAPALEPFTFNAFKQPYEVPGLKFDATRSAIVAEDPRALDRLKQMLSHGREWEARGRQELVALRRENEQLRNQPVPEKETANVFLQELQKTMAIEDDEQYLRAMFELRQTWPLLQAKAERAYAERLMQQAQAAQQPPEPDVETVIEAAQQGAEALVQQMLENQPWADPETAREITEYLQDVDTLSKFVRRATPQDAETYGVRVGEFVADWEKAKTLVDRLTKPYQRAHAQTAKVQQTAAQTTKIAAQNAAALGKPPALPQKKPQPARPATPPARPMTTEEIRAKIDADMDRAWNEMRR